MKASQKLPYNVFSWIFLLVMLGFLAKTLYDLRELFRFKPEARTEMRHLMSRVELGDSRMRVQQTFTSGSFQTLKLISGVGHEKFWYVFTPFEFGAGNWMLHIEYDERGAVVALRIRISDSVYERPRESAPPDKVSPKWRKPFP